MAIMTENIMVCLPRGLKDEVLSHVKKFSPFVETAIREKIERDYKLSTQEAITDRIVNAQAEISKLKISAVELKKSSELTDWFASWPPGDQVAFKEYAARTGRSLEVVLKAQREFERIHKRTVPFFKGSLTTLELRQYLDG